jgi:hypothetical protein
MASLDRRTFLQGLLSTGAAALGAGRAHAAEWPTVPLPQGDDLARRFPDLSRHFAFEYYPWYGGPPDYVHWDYLGRRPPLDLAARHLPRLGAYDSRSRAVLEQHARWIRDSGIGAVALSWWGPGSWEDRCVPLVMDVFRDHDLKVTFGLEPYAADRGPRFAADVLYLLREYGEKRRWDAFLLPRDEDGARGPVLKGFRTIVPDAEADCRGRVSPVGDHTPDDVWRAQIDRIRETLRGEFDRVTLLADSVHFTRAPASGFDGIGIYDNFIEPQLYATIAEAASRAGLLFSLNVNPGYDQVEPRDLGPEDECYRPRPLAPPGEYDWTRADERERAAEASARRIRESFAAAVAVQCDPWLANRQRGFFFVYVNSFNEWHEGHAFEPMKDAADLTPEERAQGYRNPARGDQRLAVLSELMSGLRRGAALMKA